MDLHTYAQNLPKVELHIHLEGAILPTTLLKLAERNHISLPTRDQDRIEEMYQFRDFGQFLDTYRLITSCLRTVDDYTLISYEFGRERARQNIRYSEVTFTILTNMVVTGLSWQAILEALNQGRRQAQREFGVDWRWIFDIVRNFPETQDQVTTIALAARDLAPESGVIALGLGGSETEFPPELFTQSFDRAHQSGLACIPHAGETAGPDSILASIQKLHAMRIGHGVRCIEDPNLVEYLHRLQIPLEVCPTSNVRLGIYPDYQSHPLRKLWDAGLYITVNSDDPPMFGTSLNREYEILVDQFGFTADDLDQISLNALHASLLSKPEKIGMEQEFKDQFSRMRTTIWEEGSVR